MPGLDGLRGVACLMVFFYHLRWNAQPSNETPLVLPFDFEFLLRKFDIGVAVFFVLSGLLLSMPFWRAILAGGSIALLITLFIAILSWRFIEKGAIRAPYPADQ